jgi:hypothetical protein
MGTEDGCSFYLGGDFALQSGAEREMVEQVHDVPKAAPEPEWLGEAQEAVAMYAGDTLARRKEVSEWFGRYRGPDVGRFVEEGPGAR